MSDVIRKHVVEACCQVFRDLFPASDIAINATLEAVLFLSPIAVEAAVAFPVVLPVIVGKAALFALDYALPDADLRDDEVIVSRNVRSTLKLIENITSGSYRVAKSTVKTVYSKVVGSTARDSTD